MGFEDVAFLPSRIRFLTFLQNGDRGESLVTTTCPKTVVVGMKGHAVCKVLLLQHNSVCVSRISWKS